MNDEGNDDLHQRIKEGLRLAEKRMLREKALHDECVVIYDPDAGAIVRVPAKEVLARHPELRM